VSLAMPRLVSIGPALAVRLSESVSGSRLMPIHHWPREHVQFLGGMTARPWPLSPSLELSCSSLGRCRLAFNASQTVGDVCLRSNQLWVRAVLPLSTWLLSGSKVMRRLVLGWRHAEEWARGNRAIAESVCHFDVASSCPPVDQTGWVPLFEG
jgi:hypothetical protein